MAECVVVGAGGQKQVYSINGTSYSRIDRVYLSSGKYKLPAGKIVRVEMQKSTHTLIYPDNNSRYELNFAMALITETKMIRVSSPLLELAGITIAFDFQTGEITASIPSDFVLLGGSYNINMDVFILDI